jgi:hypothetical protein
LALLKTHVNIGVCFGSVLKLLELELSSVPKFAFGVTYIELGETHFMLRSYRTYHARSKKCTTENYLEGHNGYLLSVLHTVVRCWYIVGMLWYASGMLWYPSGTFWCARVVCVGVPHCYYGRHCYHGWHFFRSSTL